MGEAKGKDSATAEFIKKFPTCFFCGGQATTREHMPPKSLFDGSYRPDKLVMPACARCNRETSTADLAAALVSRWNYQISDQERKDHRKLAARALKQAPALVAEWTQLPLVEKEKARQHLRNHGVPVPADAGVITIGIETIKQLNLFAHKAALALYFEKFRVPFASGGRLCAFWRTKEDFARDGIPSQLLEMLPDYGTLVQGKWDESKTFEYRYAENEADQLFGCFARLRQGLYVAGFLAGDFNILPVEESFEDDWIRPQTPLTLLTLPRFTKKL